MSTTFDPTPTRLSDKRFLEGHEFTLDTDKVHTVEAYGRYFLVRSANAEFEMKRDGGTWFLIEQGEGFDLGEQDRFTKLSFRRPPGSNEEIQIRCRTADCEMFDARLNIVRDPNRLQVITQYAAPSYAVRTLPVALAAAATLALPGILTRGVWPCAPAAGWLYALPAGVNRAQRKSLRIESSVPINLLWWNGVAANIAAGVKVASAPIPGTDVPLYEETSQDFALINPGAGAATIAILALFDVPVWFSLTSEDP